MQNARSDHSISYTHARSRQPAGRLVHPTTMPLAPHEPEQCAADSTQPAWRCMLKKLLHPSGDPAEINDPASVTEIEEREVGERATEVQEIVGRRSTTPIQGAHPLNTTIKHADPAGSGGQRARSEAQAPAAPGIEASSPRSVATAPQQQMGKEGSGPTPSPIDLGRRVRVEGYADGVSGWLPGPTFRRPMLDLAHSIPPSHDCAGQGRPHALTTGCFGLGHDYACTLQDVKYVGYVRWTGRDGIKRSRFRIGVELDRAVGLNNGTVDVSVLRTSPPRCWNTFVKTRRD